MKLSVVLAIAVLALIPAHALAQGNALEGAAPITILGNEAEVYFGFDQAYLVQTYAVTCHGQNVTSLKVAIKDCCIPGDHWEAKARLYDKKPVDMSVCASGGPFFRSVTGNTGGKPLRSIVNARYPHGVNIFPAGVYMKFTCYPASAEIEVADLGQGPDLR